MADMGDLLGQLEKTVGLGQVCQEALAIIVLEHCPTSQ